MVKIRDHDAGARAGQDAEGSRWLEQRGRRRDLLGRVDGAVSATRFIEFLDPLVRDAQRKVFLVLDNLKVHP